MNQDDASRVGLKNYDLAKIVSATNLEGVWDLKNEQKMPMISEVKIVQGVRPGVISFALGFGHWAVGASDCVIDGTRIPADARRAGGVHGNATKRELMITLRILVWLTLYRQRFVLRHTRASSKGSVRA